MRYFRTNDPEFLWFVWDGKEMWYTGSDPEKPLEYWSNDHDGDVHNPDTLNDHDLGTHNETDPLFAYETDENWNRL